MNNILTNRQYKIDGNWYAPRDYLQSYKSVIKVELYNTMSSSGTWDGFFIQRIGKKLYMINFSQDNNFPRGGFTLYTGNKNELYEDELPDNDTLYQLYEDFYCYA
jgi:hypothetical protein